ncbi:MAG: dipeptide ABC transporter ATP-binding protein [Deltaproteobacteria bacterium]|nr:dipeptide ABC transporter ATP-binding protein [Deltaproteobacteria bacterium]
MPPVSDVKPLLEVKHLTKHFDVHKGAFRRHVGTVKAVDDVSFTLERGQTISLVGESGCGKTTTGRALLRLIEPNSGEVWFRGLNVPSLRKAELRKLRRHMQVVFQDPYSSLNPRQTIGEIIGTPMVMHGLCTRNEMDERVQDVLVRVGLQAAYISRYPHEFSGGQRQRIGIARAVALQPDFIVCDEAVSALDVSLQAQIVNLLLDLKQDLGLSYIFIAHDLSVVRHISDHVVVMYLGQVVESAPCDELFSRPLHPYTQALLSAVPSTDTKASKQRFVLSGDVPSPLHPPSGCRFRTRCPLAEAKCAEPPRPLVAFGRHEVRCVHYEHGASPAAPVSIEKPCNDADSKA